MKYTSKLILNGEEYLFAEGQPGGGGRQPGVDTILYYNFENTNGNAETDLAGNYDGTYQGTPDIDTLASGKKIFKTNGNNVLNTNNSLANFDYNNTTVNVWFKFNSGGLGIFGQERRDVSTGNTIYSEQWSGDFSFWIGYTQDGTISIPADNSWNNVTIINDGTNCKVYMNGVFKNEMSTSSGLTGDKYFHVGAVAVHDTPSPQTIPSNRIVDAEFGSVIIEDKVWTAQEVADYFNQTKSLYGIS